MEVIDVPDMSDPLGAPTIVTGPQYLDALSRLGYNVENMTSTLPIMTKIAQAGTSLLDQVYQQHQDYQKAQADLAYSAARTDQLKEATDFNRASFDTRLKTLDLDNIIKKSQADVAAGMVDDQIAKAKIATQQEQENLRHAQENNPVLEQESRARSQQADIITKEMQAEQERDQKALQDYPAARALLPTNIYDPDFDDKISQAYQQYPEAMTNKKTAPLLDGVIKPLEAQRNNLASVQATRDDIKKIAALRASDNLPLDTDMDALAKNPTALHDAMVRGNLTATQRRLSEVLSSIGANPPPELRTYIDDLQNAQNRINTILGQPDAVNQVKNGMWSQFFDTNGGLNSGLDGDIGGLETYVQERIKQGVGRPMTSEIEIPSDPTNPGSPTVKITNIPPGELPNAIRMYYESVKPQTERAKEAAQKKTGTGAQASATERYAEMMRGDPVLDRLATEAQRTGDWSKVQAEVQRRLQPSGMEAGGLVPGYQGGGLVDDVANVVEPSMLAAVQGQAPDQGPAPLAVRPVSMPSQWPSLPAMAPRPQQQSQPVPSTDTSPQPSAAPARTPAVTTGPATTDINKPLPSGASAPGVGNKIQGVMITHYGYPGDANWDSKSGTGIGDRDNRLLPLQSVALTRPMRKQLFGTTGPSTGKTFQWGGVTYRDDDTAPENDLRIDVYNPGYSGLDRGVSAETAASRLNLVPKSYQQGGLVAPAGLVQASFTGGESRVPGTEPTIPRQVQNAAKAEVMLRPGEQNAPYLGGGGGERLNATDRIDWHNFNFGPTQSFSGGPGFYNNPVSGKPFDTNDPALVGARIPMAELTRVLGTDAGSQKSVISRDVERGLYQLAVAKPDGTLAKIPIVDVTPEGKNRGLELTPAAMKMMGASPGDHLGYRLAFPDGSTIDPSFGGKSPIHDWLQQRNQVRQLTTPGTIALQTGGLVTGAADPVAPGAPIVAAARAPRTIDYRDLIQAAATRAPRMHRQTYARASVGPVNPLEAQRAAPTRGTTDTVPARLTPGEFVMNREAVNRIGPTNLAAMNRGAPGSSEELTSLI